jgi:hypothetical protein
MTIFLETLSICRIRDILRWIPGCRWGLLSPITGFKVLVSQKLSILIKLNEKDLTPNLNSDRYVLGLL